MTLLIGNLQLTSNSRDFEEYAKGQTLYEMSLAKMEARWEKLENAYNKGKSDRYFEVMLNIKSSLNASESQFKINEPKGDVESDNEHLGRVSLDESSNKNHNFLQKVNDSEDLTTSFYENVLLPTLDREIGLPVSEEQALYVTQHSEELSKIASEKDWQKFRDYLRNVNDLPQAVKTEIGITVGLIFAAPIDMIHDFVNEGGVIPIEAVMMLMQRQDVQYIQALENIGVDYKPFIDKNMNLVDIASIVPSSPQVFDYLLHKSSDLNKVNEFGLDSLGVAIANAPANLYQANIYLPKLLQAGANVGEEHMLLMEIIRQQNPFIYAEIVAGNPQLILDGGNAG